MPYKIVAYKDGYKLCKQDGSKCFSKNPIPLQNTKKQMKAIAISENMKGGSKEENLKNDPISEVDVDKYLPNSRIIEYKDLGQYNTIEELLPFDNSYCFILYVTEATEDSVIGHWMVITRSIQNDQETIECFESYGYPIEYPLKEWMTEAERVRLGENIMYLSNLLDKTDLQVIYNNVPFQNRYNFDIKTCGRYAIYRTMKMLDGMSLEDFYKHMKALKRKHKAKTYDDLIIKLIDI
jgi:hypothetical protein